MHIDTREYQIIRGERDEALARVAELKEREDTTRGELRDLRGAVDRLTGMLSQCLDATARRARRPVSTRYGPAARANSGAAADIYIGGRPLVGARWVTTRSWRAACRHRIADKATKASTTMDRIFRQVSAS